VRRDHDALVWGRPDGNAPLEECGEVHLDVPGMVTINGWRVTGSNDHSTTGTGVALSRIGDRLVVRAPRPGDRIRPFGMNGTRKLSDIFIDKKIPQRERARVVVVEASGEIVWVPGVVASELTRIPAGGAVGVHLAAAPV
jgi:tRNA(Ile)-lysidine synthetase-like protein